MSSELQRKHQDMDLTAIIEHLKKMFGTQSRTSRYQLSKDLFGSKLIGNSPVGLYVNHMTDLIEELEKLGCKLDKELSQDLILQSLSESFSQFVINFNMNKMDCDLHEMLNMLIDYENQLASEKKKGIVMLDGNSSKKKGKGKSKPKKRPTAPKGGVSKPKGKEGKAEQSDV
uniref:Retrovirus-related Pol polyprotein from transposon TNT 1-94 n=1 Tax=Nicotiana tabacum TaxID=4097 RepID=A0A1S4B2L2_TOBAC